METAPWQRAAVTRALGALANGCRNSPGAGRQAVFLFDCQLASITSAVKNDEVRRLADRVLRAAEGLFLRPADPRDSDPRRHLFSAHDDLCRCLKSLDLVNGVQDGRKNEA